MTFPNDTTGRLIPAEMFEDGNVVKFAKPVDNVAREWWNEEFWKEYGLSPEGMGDLLTASSLDTKSMVYDFIDGYGKSFSLRVDGLDEHGVIWFVDRTLEMSGGYFNADEMFVTGKFDENEGRLNPNVGRKLMMDLLLAAQTLGVTSVKIQARDIGKYAWLRMGFVPDTGSWRDLRGDLMIGLQKLQEYLGRERVDEYMGIIATGRPEVATVLARLEDKVPSRKLKDKRLQPLMIPLGRALFIEVGRDWAGELKVGGDAALDIARDYANGE